MAPAHRNYDVVIVGAGPVGLLLSVCLSRWGYKVKHIDNRPLPTATGRADGLQPRTLEILKNMGLKSKIMAHDPARVFEVAFWDPSPGGKIARTGTWASCPDYLDARYPFTALLHQGLIERVLIDDIQKNGTSVQRPWTITRFETNHADTEYPVEVDLKNLDSNVIETVRSKYLFSGEGARSFVREQLGIKLRYKDPISYIWGVMDGVVRTNFPDMKMKCTIHSDHGSIMVIPREDNMVRLYIQLASSSDADFEKKRSATAEQVQATAKKILYPYTIEWDRLEWYSVYPIGQGIADKYTLDERVFMGGDVCHTHSPKAGQGMNTAFHDAINFAWKLNLVESGFAERSILSTYELERKYIAEALLAFDNKYATLFSQRPLSAKVVDAANADQDKTNDDGSNAFVETFKGNCEFTSGYGVAYTPNIFTYSATDNASPLSKLKSDLIITNNERLRPGRILPPSNVVRVVDANRVHLEDQIPFNGSFRLFVFGGNTNSPKPSGHPILSAFATALAQPDSFYSRFSYENINSNYHELDLYHEHDNPHSRLFSVALTMACKRGEIEITDLPQLFQAYRERIYADDLPDMRVPNAAYAAHAKVGLGESDAAQSAVIVVRPDGHVGIGIKLIQGRVNEAVDILEQYFAQFLRDDTRDVPRQFGRDSVRLSAQL